MPYTGKRKRSRTFKKKSFGKRRRTMVRARRRFARSRIPRGIIANQVIRKLRYVDGPIAMDAGAGPNSHGLQTFRMNSLFDPNYTGGATSHQPLGFDTLATLYSHYQVLGSKCTARASLVAAADGNEQVILMAHVDDTAGPPASSATTFLEQRGCRYAIMAGANTTRTHGKVSCTYSPRKLWAVTDPRDLKSLGAAVGANPTDVAYGNFAVASYTSGGNAGSINVYFTIDFVCLFSRRQAEAAS